MYDWNWKALPADVVTTGCVIAFKRGLGQTDCGEEFATLLRNVWWVELKCCLGERASTDMTGRMAAAIVVDVLQFYEAARTLLMSSINVGTNGITDRNVFLVLDGGGM